MTAPRWSVELKEAERGQYELSLLREDYGLGRQSWGWPEERKLVLWHNGIGGVEVFRHNREWALAVARILCDAMNEKAPPMDFEWWLGPPRPATAPPSEAK